MTIKSGKQWQMNVINYYYLSYDKEFKLSSRAQCLWKLLGSQLKLLLGIYSILVKEYSKSNTLILKY